MTLDTVLVGFSFSAGAIAFLNPCGFAMLPSYISYFVERTTNNIQIKSEGNNNNSTITRSISVRKLSVGALIGLLVTGGFVAIFGLSGLAISAIGTTIVKIFPWIAVLSGTVIIGIGIAKIVGKSIHMSIPTPIRLLYNKSSNNSTIGGGNTIIPQSKHNNYNQSRITYTRFFLFGIGYAVASLSCTLPIFLLVVFQGLSAGEIGEGMVVFLSYALGMGIIMIAISIGISISNQTFVRYLKRIVPKMSKITSVVFSGLPELFLLSILLNIMISPRIPMAKPAGPNIYGNPKDVPSIRPKKAPIQQSIDERFLNLYLSPVVCISIVIISMESEGVLNIMYIN